MGCFGLGAQLEQRPGGGDELGVGGSQGVWRECGSGVCEAFGHYAKPVGKSPEDFG